MHPDIAPRTLFAILLVFTSVQAQAALRFNFSSQAQPGAIQATPRLFDAATGFGFVERTGALPARPVHVGALRGDGKGVEISEPVFEAAKGFEKDHYNNFGMAFRVKAAPGAYAIRVRTTSSVDDTTVAVTGMQSSRLAPGVFWDAASLLPNRTTVTTQGREWSFRYVNGRDFLDIEIEPKRVNTPVGIEEIVITPIAPQPRPAGVLPAIYTLGDSTVKSYTFDEAPMSGWGQVVDKLFDPARVRVLNYSMGGRSFRNAYAEGRLNDLLLAGHIGDVVMIQFGHNDESEDEMRRFGRGSTEAMYESFITDFYLPAIRARGMVPVFVTPMSRVNGNPKAGDAYVNSFKKRKFPELMKKLGAAHGVTVVDLNARSVEFYNANGVAATTAMVMAIEAGETPGKTNDGSYANGHPANKIDGTHFRESMSKQYARIVATELARLAQHGDKTAAGVAAQFKPEVKTAIAAADWSAVHPEIARDILGGDNAYYRDQIEKLLQLGALRKDAQGNVRPQETMQAHEFIGALRTVMKLPASSLTQYADGPLSREAMAAMLADAYALAFSAPPKYMTDYNGKTVVPGAPGYDPNLDTGAQGAMYFPLLGWQRLRDTGAVSPRYAAKVKSAYELGLFRSEAGIARGRMVNGDLLEPQALVTRAKAAKALYFMWVLAQPPKAENDK
ncbi:GDSL-type esterase/lipase family protein [Massilia yuzhufengensis]|uniref:Lysophospholipase L1 n=1 Tax=Massilia yuzhufengensis TaxID=1164594 RepID=A0A1I1MZ50_9BURK|nr:GDSL-type esterase/lipase family protein [Massilia yuzhufengensis]SFC90366.1 Lysophospholipase L1 [Massilia yuzhufengensis]